jgi:hypothetical protein
MLKVGFLAEALGVQYYRSIVLGFWGEKSTLTSGCFLGPPISSSPELFSLIFVLRQYAYMDSDRHSTHIQLRIKNAANEPVSFVGSNHGSCIPSSHIRAWRER